MIVSVHPFGFFVRDEATCIEGLVHVAAMPDDFYEYDEETFSLRGRSARRKFRMGDRVRVELAEPDADFREINFRFLDKIPPRGRRREGSAEEDGRK